MNEIVNKFLLAGDTFMPEMHLKQPGFIYKNELDKACFQHDMIYLIEILKIYQGKQLQIKYYVIKHLILLKIQNMMNIK